MRFHHLTGSLALAFALAAATGCCAKNGHDGGQRATPPDHTRSRDPQTGQMRDGGGDRGWRHRDTQSGDTHSGDTGSGAGRNTASDITPGVGGPDPRLPDGTGDGDDVMLPPQARANFGIKFPGARVTHTEKVVLDGGTVRWRVKYATQQGREGEATFDDEGNLLP